MIYLSADQGHDMTMDIRPASTEATKLQIITV
jgi:hypothetical protein